PRVLFRKFIADEAELESFVSTVCPGDWTFEQDGARSFDEGLAERVAQYPEHTRLIRAFDERWIETVSGPIFGTLAILEELWAARVPTYAITNFSREKFAVLVEHHSFLRRLDGVVISAHERLLKPDPQIYLRLCERYGLEPNDCLFIDDRPENVAGALAIGMQGHLFSDPVTLGRALRAAGLPLK